MKKLFLVLVANSLQAATIKVYNGSDNFTPDTLMKTDLAKGGAI